MLNRPIFFLLALTSHMGTGYSSGCSFAISLSVYGLGKKQRMAKVLGSPDPYGRYGRGFWFLTIGQLSFAFSGYLESEAVEGRSFSLFCLLSVYLSPIKININESLKKILY